MAKITKTLSSKIDKVTGKSEIMFRFVGSKFLVIRAKSGLLIKPEFWDTTKQAPKNTKLDKDTNATRTKISELENTIINHFSETDIEKVDKQWLETMIDKYHFPEKYLPKEEIKDVTLFEFISKFIEDAPNRKDKTTGRPLTKNNIQQYNATEKHLKAFAKSIKKKDFEFSEINQKFYDKFVTYLQSSIQKVDENKKPAFDEENNPVMLKESFTQNSVGKHIRILKLMLNEATIQGVNSNQYYNSFRVFTEETDTVYLNENELQLLKAADFSKNQSYDRVRDWFLLLAWTGCRFSDLEKLTKTDIKDGFITFRQQKTNNKVTIPLHPVVLEILEKYNYNLPQQISNQKFNEYVKKVGEIVKINSIETITKTVGGKLVTVQFKKWEQISSHTGRRSFCTNMYKRGLPTLMIMSISGHKTEKSFLKYIKVKQEEHAQMMADKWNEIYK